VPADGAPALATLDFDAGSVDTGVAQLRAGQADLELTGDAYTQGRGLNALASALHQKGQPRRHPSERRAGMRGEGAASDWIGLASSLNLQAIIL
jgi:hypothetical protein